MCLEHKQYWQCCLLVDSRWIDPCPQAQNGHKCNIEERIHPISGYCSNCRRARNKLEDDAVTSPLHTTNDNYDQPWKPQKYKPVKSQPLRFPSYTMPQPEPERGRSTKRSPPYQTEDPSPASPTYNYQTQNQYQYQYPTAPLTPPAEHEDNKSTRSYRRHSPQQNTQYQTPYQDPITPLSPIYQNATPIPIPIPIPTSPPVSVSGSVYQDTPYSPNPAYNDQFFHDRKHARSGRGRRQSATGPEPIRYRIASPRTVLELQRRGVLPATEELLALNYPGMGLVRSLTY